MQCRIFRDPVMNRRIESDPNHIETLGIGKYYPKRGRPYKDMDEFSSMILDIDIKKDERRIDPQSGEYFYYKKAINYFTNRLHSILSDKEKCVICVYPTSKEGPAFTGMRTIAKRLCITTTGTSLKAGKIVLKCAGTKIVALLAFGKTITQTNGDS